MPVKKPLVPLLGEDRRNKLLAMGLDEDLIPLTATPLEKEVAMEPQLGPQDVTPPATGPAHGAVVGQVTARIGPILSVVLGAILALPAAGITLPPVVITVCSSLVAVMAALGIASPGVRKA